MDSHSVLLVLRWALLIVLWLFVLVAIASLMKTALKTAGPGKGSRARIASTHDAFNHLVVVTGPNVGTQVDVAGRTSLTMGRLGDCDVVLADDYASGHHARLFRTAAGWFVEDLASRNGTMVAGQRIDSPEAVGPGTDITIGQSTVRLTP